MPWLEKSIDHNRQNLNELWQRSLNLGAQTTAWILAANSAALVFCFNAILSGRLCDWDSLRTFGGIFLFGIATAYFSVLCQRNSYEAFSAALAKFVAESTSALRILQQIDQIDALAPEKRTAEILERKRKLREQFAAKKGEIEKTDITPKRATAWMDWSNYLLAASCLSLGGGAMSALWFLPPSALCAAP